MYYSSMLLMWLSNQLEYIYLLLVTILFAFVCKLTLLVFNLILWSIRPLLRRCRQHFQEESLSHFSDDNNASYSLPPTVECTETQVTSPFYIGNIDIFRSINNKKAKKELNRNLHKNNETKANSSLHSTNNQQLSPVTTECLSPISAAASRINLLEQEHNSQNAIATEITSYTTNILPRATASRDQHYETNFNEHMVPPSVEETREQVRPVPKEDVDSMLQSYQKIQIASMAVGNISQPLVQDKTKLPAKAVPSSSVNKSHRPLPRRACLVYHKEQYYLDHNLLSQPRATKYLVKIRTEISPGRYMAKLELHCSSDDDNLPNSDTAQQDADNSQQAVVPSRERIHFPSNITKTGKTAGYAIFSNNGEETCYRSCLLYMNKHYVLDRRQLQQLGATGCWYLAGGREETSSEHYIAIMGRRRQDWPHLYTATVGMATNLNEEAVIKFFPFNFNKTGYMLFSSDKSFSGHIRYPLPSTNAQASKIGHGGNGFVFTIYHDNKEYAVKKTVYRSNEIDVHSRLHHQNIIKLYAVLIGENHYVYHFLPRMDTDLRKIAEEHGCLKHIKMQLVENREQWELVLVNVKHVLRSVLKALDYLHSQGLVHRDIKASDVLIKKTCRCTEVLYCNCQRGKFLVQIGDFDSSETVPGYQLQLEEHQMIQYASVLPLGTMGYRAPEVSMHLVLSGPYEVLYTTSVDIWSFGCLLLTIFIGKSGPLKQRGEASLLLSAQGHPYSHELYLIVQIKELQKYYANTPGVCDLVQKCLQVQPYCRPTAKELLQLDFFSDPM